MAIVLLLQYDMFSCLCLTYMTNNGISATVQLLQDFKDDEALGIPPPTYKHTHR